MARVPYLDKEDLRPEDQDLLARPINLFRALVNSPKARRHMQGLAHYLRYDSSLDPRLRELAILQVGYTVRSPYEWSHHIKIAKDFGIDDADIAAIVAVSEGRPVEIDNLALTVLAAAREMTVDDAVSADTFAKLKAALDTEPLVDLMLAIAWYNCVVRLLASLEIDVEPEYLQYLEKFPLPSVG